MSTALPALPPAFKIPANFGLAVKLFATGTETYLCDKQSAWQFIDAEATLNNEVGANMGKHRILDIASNGGFASFEHKDKSAVIANYMVYLTPISAVNGNNLPETKLQVTSKSSIIGSFSKVEYVLRMNPKGLSPTSKCTPGEIDVIPYTAEYWFLKPN